MSNKFWKGMLWGALVGGAVSLFDKDTRHVMKGHCQKVSEMIKNPGQTYDQVKEAAIKIKTVVEQVNEDLSYISEKVEELRETTPQVANILKETKEAFSKKEEEIELDQEDWAL
jgi:gas vesicle protein